jgi:hypothetical protein
MAVKTGHILDSRVLRGLAMQDVEVDLLISPCNTVHNERVRECSINRSRNELQRIASTIDTELVLLMDSDVVLTDSSTVSKMVEQLGTRNTCVAVQTKDKLDNHVVTACAVVHKSDYDRIDFSSTPSICQCSLIAITCGAEYLRGVEACEV